MPDVRNYFCETCAISTPRLDVETGRVCNRTRSAVKDTDFCSHHAKELWKCDCCGNQFWSTPYIIMNATEDGVVDSIDACICPQCNHNLYTCRTCQNMDKCKFESDPSPLPKVVQKTIQDGFITTVTQVMNPERIAITCEKGCPCWSQNFGCSKQNHGTCQQYHMNRV